MLYSCKSFLIYLEKLEYRTTNESCRLEGLGVYFFNIADNYPQIIFNLGII